MTAVVLKVRARNKPCCPLCRVELTEDNRYECSGCQTTYHEDCAIELGGCGTLGCARMGVKPEEPTPENQRLGARARRRAQANRARRTSGRRLRAEHQEEGGESSWSWLPLFLEGLFYAIFAIFEIFA
jgi:hypothetical protein